MKMKTYGLSCLLLLLFSINWDAVDCLCSLDKYTAAICHDLEDARYIKTYHLHTLRAPSESKILSPGNFDNLTSLRHLDLSRGNIKVIQSNSFAKLGSLQTLNLADNHINHLEAGAFDGLHHVHSLTLQNNAIRQLPSALMSLKELKLLDISNNPLNCNCASLKLRDALLTRGVKIVKKTFCSEPISVKHASIWKPDTKTTCLFEKQDLEMQGDQPSEDVTEGSGETEQDEEETVIPPTEVNSSSEVTLTTQSGDLFTDIVSSSTSAFKDDITFEDSEDSSRKETTTNISTGTVLKPEDSDESDSIPDVDVDGTDKSDEHVSSSVSSSPSSESMPEKINIPFEGSGETDDDANSIEGSGIFPHVPKIDFTETSEGLENEEEQTSPSSTTTTTESSNWLDSIFSNLYPWGSSATTAAPRTTEKSPEEDLKEEQFIQVVHESTTGSIKEPEIEPKTVVTDEATLKKIPEVQEIETNDLEDNVVDTEPSQETQKGIGSYVVLISLLVILAILLGLAVYKGDFCRKKRKRRDVERGTEMKDMQKTLLDQNTAQPKVQALNGNTMENVPLMNSSIPDEPKNNQKRYDVTHTPISNGSSKTNGTAVEVNDPVKPSRKSLKQEIEAPLNGLNPPMEAIDGPAESLHSDSNEIINTLDYCEKPPLTPGAHRVKITLQENPDSVPKTPILITRVKDGESLVKKP